MCCPSRVMVWRTSQSKSSLRHTLSDSVARADHAACYLGIGNKPIKAALLLSE